MKTFTKQIIMMCLMMCISHTGLAQCNSWLFLSSPNPTLWGARSVTTDQDNNVYSTGYFTGSVSFGNKTLTNSNGKTSFYINKFNSSGEIQWAIQIPVTTCIWPPVICQKNGILYVAAAFSDTIVIGANPVTTSSDYYALVVLKLDLNGNILNFVPAYGGFGNTLAYALGITVNSLNEIYLTGRADGDFTFGSVVLNNSGGSYTYLAKFSSDLNTVWAIQSASMAVNPRSRGWGITLDNNENIIIGGWFKQEIEFGTTVFNANNSMGGVNPYIAKFDNAGNCQWIRGGEGSTSSSTGPAYTVVSDKSGNIYYTGTIDDTMTFEGNTLNKDNGVFFYCKYTPAGDLVWAHQAGNNTATDLEAPTSLVIDSSNNIWSSGWTDDPSSFGVYTLPHWSVFIAKLDLDGIFHGVIGGDGLGSSYQSVLDADGNLYLGGSAAGDTISFDGNTIININDTTTVDFVLKYCTAEIGIEPVSKNDNPVSVFPDPSTGKFTITIPSATKEIQISNSMGQVIQAKYVDNEKSMDFELADNGIYLIRINTDRQILTRKIIICK